MAEAGIERPRLEARLLLAHALGMSQEALLQETAAPADMARYAPLLARRAAREPLARIVGRREFWSLSFAVSPATLVPRPDTETLLEATLMVFPDRRRVRSILDLGTGSGCLLLAALAEFPEAFGVGIDRAPEAARVAAGNAEALRLAERAAFLVGDWAAALNGRFDLVLSNPPYVASGEIAGLMPEIARFEPASALDGGSDGLDAYRRLIPVLPGLLNPGGAAVLELGEGQSSDAAGLAGRAGMAARTCADLAGIPRALVLRNARS